MHIVDIKIVGLYLTFSLFELCEENSETAGTRRDGG